ncbi:D-glycero-beta-D-manno-heptose 1,7-bisphosphate 7-phosphatase [Geobacter sp. DSM 9736]|uniref:D-glycero-beta-D-manno-heptose 1,7-bisphosphate 7-phosphatase n=1 Tax=Geobacter sp. DSM 9736 TaxID=1277350 RepID=UPI000B509ED1|nr:D-glycero-beta-D-manno-heptose 1,7-bisphosphate 7-phosphatase [Geobacter sp. DSM 9736]
MRTKRAVFLDRDGTINVDTDYVHRAEDFEFIPGAPEAIRLLKEAGLVVVVVTNQSGIGRGYYDEEALADLHRYLDTELAPVGASIDAYYFCPHHPEHAVGDYRVDCSCRKPLPGMLEQAACDLDLDLRRSFMVGDKLSDVEAGLQAGCRTLLVRTGYGDKAAPSVPEGVTVCDDLMSAARSILAELSLES